MMCVCKYFEHSRRRAILHDFQSSFVPREAESEETYEEQTKLFVFLSPRFHGCLALMLVEEYRKPSSNASLHNFDIVDR